MAHYALAFICLLDRVQQKNYQIFKNFLVSKVCPNEVISDKSAFITLRQKRQDDIFFPVYTPDKINSYNN